MKKIKRILALAGAILLIGLYLSTLIFAFINTEKASQLLQASIALTIVVPVLFYAFLLVYRTVTKNEDDDYRD